MNAVEIVILCTKRQQRRYPVSMSLWEDYLDRSGCRRCGQPAINAYCGLCCIRAELNGKTIFQIAGDPVQ